MTRLIIMCLIVNLIRAIVAQNNDYVIGSELRNRPGAAASESERFVCPEPNPAADCSCMYAITDYEIQCPIVNPEITIKIKPEAYAQVQCYERQDLSGLPSLKTGNVTQLKIMHCPLPGNTTILQLINFLGVKNVKDFWYQNYGRSTKVQMLRPHFAGMQGLEKLFLSARIDYIPPDLFADVRNLKWLILQGNYLTRLGRVFQNLSELIILELGANHIVELDPGFLYRQSKLRHLNLWHNEIRKVSKDTFEGLGLLEDLDLSVNFIDSLDRDVFARLTKLSTLNIGFNRLQNIPMELLLKNRVLKEFKLIHNQVPLQALPTDLLSDLPLLQVVLLSRNELPEIPNSIFFESSAIQHIDLSFNRLRTIPEQLFRDQSLIQHLNLAYNELEDIPDGLFKNASELVVLNLSFNQLKNVSASIFASLGKLTELHLENNELFAIDLLSFLALRSLENLFLQNNNLVYQDSMAKSPFQHLSNLRILNLKNNSISTILRDWSHNTLKLRELDLSFNNFTQIEHILFTSRDIQIDLSYNQISWINVTDYETATSTSKHHSKTGRILVNLSANPLDCSCNLLPFVLYIQENKDSALPIRFSTQGTFCTNPDHLQGTAISEVSTFDLICPLNESSCPIGCNCFERPNDFSVVVNCSSRGHTHIPDLSQTNMRQYNSIVLHVENNAIVELPSYGLEAVSQLYARNNSITDLLHIHLASNLRVLDVSDNLLTTLNTKTIQTLNNTLSLERLYLGSNPWKCDCNSAPFLDFVQQTFQLIVDVIHVNCPNGQRIIVSSIHELCKERSVMIIAVSLSILVLGLFVGISTALCFAYHKEIKIWLFKRNLCLGWITEQEVDNEKQFDAFISYSHHDEDFVANHLVPTLEQPPMNFRTCWHMRDWIPGEMIAEQITRSINDSRRTIVVLSKSFLDSVWAQMEFRTAHLNSIAEKRSRVIVILYEHFGDIEQLDADLKAYLKMNTYIRWGDPWFWDRLQYAMPHPPRIRGEKVTRRSGCYNIGMIENKLELSKSQIVALDAYRGYLNPTLSRSIGRSLDEIDSNDNFEGIDIIDSRYLDELFIIITKESEV